MSSVTMLNSVLWLKKCSSIVKLLKSDLTVHLQISGTHKFPRGNASHCIFIGCLKVCVYAGRAVKMPSFISSIKHSFLAINSTGLQQVHPGSPQRGKSHEPHLGWLQMQDVYAGGSPPPQILPVQEMAVLSSHALSKGGNSLGFADKNSSSFQVGLC